MFLRFSVEAFTIFVIKKITVKKGKRFKCILCRISRLIKHFMVQTCAILKVKQPKFAPPK